MASVLLHCPNHGTITSESAIAGDAVVELLDGTINCPLCGTMSEVLDGTYTMRDSAGLATIYRPTPAAARRLRTVLAWAESASASATDPSSVAAKVERQIEREAPQLSPWLTRAREEFRSNPSGWLGVLIALIALFVTVGANQGISAEDLERILDETVRSAQTEPELTGDATPTPRSPRLPGSEEPPPARELPTPKTR